MTIRFSDNILADIEGSDFVIRNRIPRLVQIIIIFLAAFDLICFAAYITNDASISIGFLLVLLGSISTLGVITFFFLNRFRRLILSTEFQTAMLASAAQLGTRFCFIVNREGAIFYVDPGFQKFFSSFINSGSRTLKSLLAYSEVPGQICEKINATIKQNKSDHVILQFRDASGQPVPIRMTIDVIPRPKGYFIIRGRDYIEKRAEEKPVDNVEDGNTLALLMGQAFNNVSGGVLIANNHGKIAFVNEELETWLGYAPGEILHNKMRVGQVFHQYAGHEEGVLLLNNFQGEVILQRKNRALMAMKAHQTVLTENGQTLGISAIMDLQGS